MEDELEQINQQVLSSAANNAAFDDIGLQDKMIEPHNDRTWAQHVNRNLQNGNLDVSEYRESKDLYNVALKYFGIPEEYGGLDFCYMMADNNLKEINFSTVLSNSKEGHARKLQYQRYVEIAQRKLKQKGWMNGGKDK